MSGGRMSGGRLSGGLKSYDRICRPIACRRASWLSYSCLASKSTWFYM